PPLLPIPLPTSSPPLLLPSTECRVNVPKVMLPPRKRLCISLGPRFEVEECSSAPITRPTGGFRLDYGFVTTLDAEIGYDPEREIGYEITDNTDEIYRRLDDVQDDRSLMSGQLNLLLRDRRAHAHTTILMETEARLSHKAWAEIEALRAANRTRQAQLVEALTLLKSLQTQVTTLQSQQTPTRDPAHPDVPEEAGSSS
nr:hypothetical protein [Tanacetum cinerariifolium]